MNWQILGRNTRGRFGIGPLLVVLMVALVAAVPPTPVLADGPLEVLQVGWDGTVVPGSWSPVRVRVTGSDVDSSARVEVVLKAWYQPGPQAARVETPVGAYGQEVSLPMGVTKEVTVWVPAQGNMVGVVQLSGRGQLLAEERVEFRASSAPTWPLVGVLAEAPSVARSVGQIELPFQSLPVPLSVARLSAADLPASPERLAALGALVVQGNAATALTGEQRKAVQNWVIAGGHLVLAGGPEAPRAAAALPSGVLPISFSEADSSAELSGLASWAGTREAMPAHGPAARFRAEAGAVLAGPPDRPLAWRLGLGSGTVTLLAADPSLQPLVAWSGTPTLLQKALEPALPRSDDNEKQRYLAMEQGNEVTRLLSAVEMVPARAYPDWRMIALILGGFAVVVGPFLHIVLRRLDRRGWSWVVVPAVALIATGTLYVLGVGWGGRDVLANVVAHVRLDPEAGRAFQSLAAGFYAPTRPDLAIGIPGDFPVRAMSRGTGLSYDPMGMPIARDPGVQETEVPFRVLSGRETRVEFAAEPWAMRSVAFEGPVDEDIGRITAHLRLAEGLIKGSLRNDTPFTIEDAAVVVGYSLAKLGSLAPGQTAAVILEAAPAMNPYMGGYPLSYRLFARTPEELAASGQGGSGGVSMYQSAMAVPAYPPAPRPPSAMQATPAQPPQATPAAVTPRPAATAGPASSLPQTAQTMQSGPPERLELPRDSEVRRRSRLFDTILSVHGPGPNSQLLPLTFVGFVQGSVGQNAPSAGNHPTYQLTLLEQPLSLEFAPGPFSIPAGLTPATMLVQSSRGMGGGSNGLFTWVEINDSSLTYGYRPSLPRAATAEALVVTARQIGPATPTAAGRGSPPGPGVSPGPAEVGVFTVFNWQAADWDTLPTDGEVIRLQAAPYLGPDGLVQIQVTTPAGHSVRFLIPELTVEGTVGG